MAEMLDARYQVVRLLGKGAMGEVYLTYHVTLGRRDALKVLRADLNKDPKFASRLRREARAANRVQHPNIVSVFDFGQLPDGRYYIAMEYVDGPGLDAILSAGPLSIPRALRVLRQLADAVDYAHRAGVVHRDLKPSNLIVISHRTQPDFLKILDFGVAKIIDPGYEETALLTGKGELLGTPAYMAPEQFRGSAPDPRWDIYSIGCIAYEILTGKPPFSGPLPELVRCHLAVAPPDPTLARPELPAPVRDLILRCLAKNPGERPDARELTQRIDEILAPRRARAATMDSDFANEPTGRFEAFGPVDDESVRATVRDTLRSALEAIVDSGTRDTRFVVALTHIRRFEDEIQRCTAQDATLRAQGDAIEQAARERINSLRFALGELEFDQQRAGSPGSPAHADLGEQIAALERRLVEVEAERGRDLRVIDDQQIGLAADRANAEEALEAAWTEITPALQGEIERAGKGSTLGVFARHLSLLTRR